VLHLACHGYFDAEDALRSGILLAPADDDSEATDATLTAEDLLDLRLRADLVTLSACQSGVNEQRPGDELIGLTRALIYAGTPSVIVSLWRVDDLSAGLLMRGFYERLRGPDDGTSTKAHALQAAQLEVMRRTAGQVVDDCTQRLAAAGDDPDRRSLLELELASAHATAGNLNEAVRIADEVAGRAEVAPRLAQRAARTAAVLRFKQQVDPPAVGYDAKPFEHLAHWAPFVLVGDWD
jgi:CHAT domain-containing protein